MHTRLVFVNLLAGYVAGGSLAIIFREIWPGYIFPQFSSGNLNPGLSWLAYGLAAILALVSGYISAKLEWAKNRMEAVKIGAIGGFVYGCITYLVSNAPAAAGMMGQQEVLLGTLRFMRNRNEGIQILLDSVFYTALWNSAIFWGILLASILLGSLGGLLATIEETPNWGSRPAWKGPHLGRMIVNTINFFSIITMGVIFGAYGPLQDVVFKTFRQYGYHNTSFRDNMILGLPAGSTLIWIGICCFLITSWMISDWRIEKEKGRVIKKLIWFAVFTGLYFLATDRQIFWITLAAIGLAALIAGLVHLFLPPRQEAVLEPPRKFNLLDLLAASGFIGVGISAMLMSNLIGYALSLTMISVESINHLTKTGGLNYNAKGQIENLFDLLTNTTLAGVATFFVLGLVIVGIARITGAINQKAKPLSPPDFEI